MALTENSGPVQGAPRNLYMDGALVLTAVLMGLTLYLVFLWVPTELNLGVSQRIFYFHVPISMWSLGAIVVTAFASIAYLVLKKNQQRWDSLAYASAEVGLLFSTLSLITGVLWTKPVWGVWWTWELKLTLTLIVWFIYASYLMLDNYGPKGSQGDRFRAVVAVIGVIAASMNWVATKIADRRAHPDTIVLNMDLDGTMAAVLLLSLAVFTLLFGYLLADRYYLRRAERDVDQLYRDVQ
jgi:heme exporter protein C